MKNGVYVRLVCSMPAMIASGRRCDVTVTGGIDARMRAAALERLAAVPGARPR